MYLSTTIFSIILNDKDCLEQTTALKRSINTYWRKNNIHLEIRNLNEALPDKDRNKKKCLLYIYTYIYMKETFHNLSVNI